MTFLTWNNEKDAEGSLAAVNTAYGCPYRGENGYRMDQWDELVSSRNVDQWGFYKPVERLGQMEQYLRAYLISGFVENIHKPDEFYPIDPDADPMLNDQD